MISHRPIRPFRPRLVAGTAIDDPPMRAVPLRAIVPEPELGEAEDEQREPYVATWMRAEGEAHLRARRHRRFAHRLAVAGVLLLFVAAAAWGASAARLEPMTPPAGQDGPVAP